MLSFISEAFPSINKFTMYISLCGLHNYPTLFGFASIWITEKIVLQAEIRIF